MKTKKQIFIRLVGVAAWFVASTILSAAFSPIDADDVAVLNDRAARKINISTDDPALVDDLHSPMVLPTYDALHSLQSGMRTADEIQDHIARIAGQGPVVQWNSDFWQKNNIKGPLNLTTILSDVQNLETRSEVMHVLILPSEKQREADVTLFTDRMNDAEISTLHSAILLGRSISLDNGRPVYDPKEVGRYNFHLNTSSDESHASDLREPEGAYELKPVAEKLDEQKPAGQDTSINPFAELSQVDGSFNEIGNYEYDQELGGQHCTVSIIPRWNAAAHAGDHANLTIEVQIHEAESLNVRSFVLVYE